MNTSNERTEEQSGRTEQRTEASLMFFRLFHLLLSFTPQQLRALSTMYFSCMSLVLVPVVYTSINNVNSFSCNPCFSFQSSQSSSDSCVHGNESDADTSNLTRRGSLWNLVQAMPGINDYARDLALLSSRLEHVVEYSVYYYNTIVICQRFTFCILQRSYNPDRSRTLST